MTVSITHAKVTTGTVNDDVEVDLSDWNDAHVVPIATQAEAEAGTSSSVLMTPERTAQAIAELAGAGSGDVVGPASATNNNIAVFDTTTGKLIKDGGATVASLQPLDADLTAIAALSPSDDDIIQRKSGAWSARSILQFITDLITGGFVRERLSAARSYYVRSDGSDSNTGLANTSGGAFLTPQAAITAIKRLDLNGYAVTVYCLTGGTYPGFVVDGPFVGDVIGTAGGLVTFVGETSYSITNATNATPIVVTFSGATPANGEVVAINSVGGNTAANGCWTLAGVSGSTAQLVNSVGNGAYTSGGTATFTSRTVIHGTATAGTAGDAAVSSQRGGSVNISGFKLKSTNAYTISAIGGQVFCSGPIQYDTAGSGINHIWSTQYGYVAMNSRAAVSAGGYQFLQASHYGAIRWNTYPIEFVADAAFSSSFAYSDNGEIIGTPAVSVNKHSYTVTAGSQYLISNGIIQINGYAPPQEGFFPGGATSGIWSNSATPGAGPAYNMVSSFPYILGGTSGVYVFKSDGTKVNLHITDAGVSEFGSAGSVVGRQDIFNATSGSIQVSPPTGALGTVALTWPSASGTIATTGSQILTVTKQVFTSSGTYTPTSGMAFAIIECIGPGGGGGATTGSATGAGGGGGGGGGGYARTVVTAATVGASKAVTVGTGGAGGTAGNNNGSAGSGATSVGTLCIANAGSGGKYGSPGAQVGTGGAGGAVGTGDVTTPGSPGHSAVYATTVNVALPGAPGGSSAISGGAASPAFSSPGIAGINATGYGGGGSGAQSYATTNTYAGGNGADGLVIITEFIK